MNRQNLWAPWRMAYLHELGRRQRDATGPTNGSSDFFADYWARPEHDEAHHVIERDAHGMILLNRYPYANGHLLVALGKAAPSLLDYEEADRAALWRLVDRATALMQRALNPQGINIGVNQGEAAGAGVPEHLHAHLVPRWSADTNFISVIGDVRIIPSALDEMARVYRGVISSAL